MKEGCPELGAEKFSIIVLAGGKSSRMGRDKATLPWRNGDILGSLLIRLLPLSDDVIVVSHIVRNIPATARQVADLIPGKGPLSGIHTGLMYACHDLVLVTACDVPFLVPALLPELAHAVGLADGSVVVYNGQIQPLFACYHKRCGPVIEQLLARKQWGVRDFLACIQWVPVKRGTGLTEDCIMNVNTSEDYEKAKVILAKGE